MKVLEIVIKVSGCRASKAEMMKKRFELEVLKEDLSSK